jgi:DNA-binding response OmpR family regulator
MFSPPYPPAIGRVPGGTGTILAPAPMYTDPFPDLAMTTATDTDRKTVLVADDEPYIGRIIQMKLEDGPYRVELVHDGRAALDRLRTDETFDLVLLDIMMPHASGLDVLAALRQLPHRSGTPVIMLTAKGQDADRERAAEYGATDFLTKPFSPKKLLARIDELFDR